MEKTLQAKLDRFVKTYKEDPSLRIAVGALAIGFLFLGKPADVCSSAPVGLFGIAEMFSGFKLLREKAINNLGNTSKS